jgi:predicted HicB family RNase H-like nuclease
MASKKPELPSGKFVLRIPRSLHAKLQVLSADEGVSMNQLVATYLAEAARATHLARREAVRHKNRDKS